MKWTEIKYINLSELTEIRSLQALWGMEVWKKHASRELVRCYNLEADRQKLIYTTPANCRNDEFQI